jgi:hypothetical protein
MAINFGFLRILQQKPFLWREDGFEVEVMEQHSNKQKGFEHSADSL